MQGGRGRPRRFNLVRAASGAFAVSILMLAVSVLTLALIDFFVMVRQGRTYLAITCLLMGIVAFVLLRRSLMPMRRGSRRRGESAHPTPLDNQTDPKAGEDVGARRAGEVVRERTHEESSDKP